MTTQKLLEYVQDVLITVHANLEEIRGRKQFADKEELDYIEAKIMAYQEIIAIFRMTAREFNLSEQDLGI
jgi:hypothetical protein